MKANLKELYEQLAAIEHERWTNQLRSVLAKGDKDPRNGDLIIPAATVERWEQLVSTPYNQLSEEEKAKDRQQVDRYMKLIVASNWKDDGEE